MTAVTVVPYDAAWPKQFAAESEALRKALGPNCVDVVHIGSTAIPGISAKPIIDIIPIVKNICEVTENIEAMTALGYTFKGEFGIPFRRHFVKPGYNIHVFSEDDAEIWRNLRFRDYLIEHPEIAQQYSTLKLNLAEKFPEDPAGYFNGKDRFIAAINHIFGFKGHTLRQIRTFYEQTEHQRICLENGMPPPPVEELERYRSGEALKYVYFALMLGTQMIGSAKIDLTKIDTALDALIIEPQFQRKGHEAVFIHILDRWGRQSDLKILLQHMM